MAEVGLQTIVDFERGAREPRKSSLKAIHHAFEVAGIEFLAPRHGNDWGLRFRPHNTEKIINDTKSSEVTAAQIKAARALLGWSQANLSEHSGVSLPTIKRLELSGPDTLIHGNVQAVRKAFNQAGILFIDRNGGGPGVRLRE